MDINPADAEKLHDCGLLEAEAETGVSEEVSGLD